MSNIELQPFHRADFTQLINWIPSAKFMLQWSGPQFRYPLDRTQLEEYLRSSEMTPPLRCIYKAVNADTGAHIGHIELSFAGAEDGTATIARVLVGDPAIRGQGIGTAMIRRIIDIGFREFGMNRLYLSVFDFNKAAITCYRRLGFLVDRHPWRVYETGGERWTTSRMCLCRDDSGPSPDMR